MGIGTDPDLQLDIITELDLVNTTRGVTQVSGLHNASKAFLFQGNTSSFVWAWSWGRWWEMSLSRFNWCIWGIFFAICLNWLSRGMFLNVDVPWRRLRVLEDTRGQGGKIFALAKSYFPGAFGGVLKCNEFPKSQKAIFQQLFLQWLFIFYCPFLYLYWYGSLLLSRFPQTVGAILFGIQLT